jgi:hypothetical protein
MHAPLRIQDDGGAGTGAADEHIRGGGKLKQVPRAGNRSAVSLPPDEWPADLADLQVSERWLDDASDVSLVCLPCRKITVARTADIRSTKTVIKPRFT